MSASAWDRAVEAAVEHLRVTHWDGNGCGTHGTSACSRCYGPSPAGAREVSEEVLAAALPVLLEELAQRIEAGTEGDYRAIPYRQSMQRAARMVRGFAAEVTQ